MGSANIRLALTCDDAPTISGGDHGLVADPSRMDLVREVLVKCGVSHCVAFVIGKMAEGEEDRLSHWLEAGYELGNHTYDHLAARRVDSHTFLKNVARCGRLLESVDAFACNRRRVFRYPYLDRGSDPDARARIHAGLADLGYTIAHATVDFYDHCYEAPLAAALAERDSSRVRTIEDRYVKAACNSLKSSWSSSCHITGRNVPQIAYFHMGVISPRVLPRMLERLAQLSVSWCSLTDALTDTLYQEFDADPSRTGLVTAGPPSIPTRLKRKLARFSQDRGWFGQHDCGPCWPYLG